MMKSIFFATSILVLTAEPLHLGHGDHDHDHDDDHDHDMSGHSGHCHEGDEVNLKGVTWETGKRIGKDKQDFLKLFKDINYIDPKKTNPQGYELKISEDFKLTWFNWFD